VPIDTTTPSLWIHVYTCSQHLGNTSCRSQGLHHIFSKGLIHISLRSIHWRLCHHISFHFFEINSTEVKSVCCHVGLSSLHHDGENLTTNEVNYTSKILRAGAKKNWVNSVIVFSSQGVCISLSCIGLQQNHIGIHVALSVHGRHVHVTTNYTPTSQRKSCRQIRQCKFTRGECRK